MDNPGQGTPGKKSVWPQAVKTRKHGCYVALPHRRNQDIGDLVRKSPRVDLSEQGVLGALQNKVLLMSEGTDAFVTLASARNCGSAFRNVPPHNPGVFAPPGAERAHVKDLHETTA
jgi:hypothetical protein